MLRPCNLDELTAGSACGPWGECRDELLQWPPAEKLHLSSCAVNPASQLCISLIGNQVGQKPGQGEKSSLCSGYFA